MAHVYEAGVAHTTGAAAGHVATVVTTAAERVEIMEIGVFATTAVAGEVGLGRPAAIGTGTTGGQLGVAMDSADVAATASLTGAFGTLQPTAPTNIMRRIQLPAVIGAGVVWTWNRGEFIVPVSANLCVWQFSAAAVGYDCYVKWYE